MTENPPRTRTWMFVLLGVIVVVAVIAVVAVFTRGATTVYPADSPEGVVQRYSEAVIDGDYATAKSYLAPDIVDSCDRVSPDAYDHRVTLVRTTERDDTATVEVVVTTSYESGPFGGSEYDNDTRFELVRDGNGWLLSGVPWELSVCANGSF